MAEFFESFFSLAEYFFKCMFFYYEVLIVLVVLGFFLIKKSKLKYKNEIYMGAVFLILFCLSAFRYDVGVDYLYGYSPMWRSIISTPFSNWKSIGVEPGYVMLNYFTNIFTDHFQGIFIVTSFIIVSLMCLYIYKYFPDKLWGTFLIYGLGYYFVSMCFIRQAIALFIVVFALMFARKKKIIPYMLLVLLASSFHKSALLMIPFYFILQIKFTKKTLYIYSAITLLILTFSEEILSIVTKYIYGSYSLTGGSVFTNIGNSWYTVVPPIAYFAILFYFKDKLLKNDSGNNVLINCAFFSMFFYLIGLKHSTIDRLTMYFEPAVALAMTILIVELRKERNENKEEKKARNRLFIVTLSIIFLSISLNIRQLYSNGCGVVPYQSIFGNEEYQRYCQAIEENDQEFLSAYEKISL